MLEPVDMGGRFRIFVISPRTRDVNGYWTDICKVAALSERYGLTGVLLFTGNDTYLEPWAVTHELLRRTTSISPLVAVNPIYMHPFTVAKMIASLVRLYGRKIYLNMITGTALSHQKAMGDRLSHDERYDRLGEYIRIVKGLLGSTRPLNFIGDYYQADQLQLFPGISSDNAPEFLLSGQSEAARRVCVATGSTGMQMLPARLEDGLPDIPGVHFGIVSRETEDAAWEAAKTLFPENEEYRTMLEYSMANTDAAWKRRMKAESEHAAAAGDGYWLAPFANFQADCPYLVGTHEYVAERLQQLVQRGATTFVLDVPAREEEFLNLGRVLQKSGIRPLS
jgi:alkanesulfonate monooxygenase